MGNRCGFQDQRDSFAQILSSNSPAAFWRLTSKAAHVLPFMRINQALLCSKHHTKSHWHKQTSASRFCSVFLVGWRGILLCVNFIREITLMEKPLSGPRLVTMAWQHVPSGVSQVHARAQVQLGEEAQLFQVVRRGRPDIGERPHLCHIHFPAKDAPSSPVSLTRDEEVLTGNFGFVLGP